MVTWVVAWVAVVNLAFHSGLETGAAEQKAVITTTSPRTLAAYVAALLVLRRPSALVTHIWRVQTITAWVHLLWQAPLVLVISVVDLAATVLRAVSLVKASEALHRLTLCHLVWEQRNPLTLP